MRRVIFLAGPVTPLPPSAGAQTITPSNAINIAAVVSINGQPATATPNSATRMAKDDTVRTEIRRGNSSAIVVQSGDPKSATVHVERRPGYVKIEQRGRGSSATVIQIDESAEGKR